jgi:RNA polymerase sigma-B factor
VDSEHKFPDRARRERRVEQLVNELAELTAHVPTEPCDLAATTGGVDTVPGRARTSATMRSEADIREELVAVCLPAADAIARSYAGRGEAVDDLVQAAREGLVKAVRAFDPTISVFFMGYAIKTMKGEVRRHFRQHGWALRPGRRVQELRVRVARSQERLTQHLGRSPRPSDIAADLQVDVDDVIEALASSEAYNLTSLDAPLTAGSDSASSLGDTVPDGQDEYAHLDNLISLQVAVQALSERQRRVLLMRYWHEATQQAIGEEIGVTQMQVSRILARAHAQLRAQLIGEHSVPAAEVGGRVRAG